MAGPQFLWFLPLSHGKNAVALLVKKDSRLQLPPEHLLDVVHDFLSQEVILSYPANPIQQKGGHAAALLLMLPAVLRLRFGTPFGIFTPLFLFYHFCLSLGVQFNGITF